MTAPSAREGGPLSQVGRSYTRARKFPWVVGKIQGWQIPFGPYTAVQLGVLVVGVWLLVQTFPLWSQLGPLSLIVVALPPAATWAVRHAKIDGRTPLRALAGYLALLAEPAQGRIRGRDARDPRPSRLTGKIRLAALPAEATATAPEACAARPATDLSLLPGFDRVPAEPAPIPASRTNPLPAAPAAKTVGPSAGCPAPTGLQALLAASANQPPRP